MNFRERIMRLITKNGWFVRAFALTAIIVPFCTVTLSGQSPIPPKKWVVVIDAGHGGKDPGCVSATSKEKTIALAIALKTGYYIKQNMPDVKVIYTRDDDTFIGLDERAEVANSNKADLFISLHVNSSTDKRPKGTESYVMGQTKDEENLKLAMKENSVITLEDNYQAKYEGYDPTSAESFIIFSMMQNTFMKQSTELASLVQRQFTERVGRYDRGVKQAGYLVLWRTTMPSILVEVGFLSNAEEEKYLNSAEGQEYLASAIYRAFRQYKQTIDLRSGMSNSGTYASAGNSNEADHKAAEQQGTAVSVLRPDKDKAMPKADEIWFGVQVASNPAGKAPAGKTFPGTDTITVIDAGDRIKYIAGVFGSYEEASVFRKSLKDSYPDAFVVAVWNGKIVPLREAIEEKKKSNGK